MGLLKKMKSMRMFRGAPSREATSSANTQWTCAQFENAVEVDHEHLAAGGPPAVDQGSSSPPAVAAAKHERDIATDQDVLSRYHAREAAEAMASLDQWQRTDTERDQAAGRLADAPKAPPAQPQSMLERFVGVTCGVRLACDADGEWENDAEPSNGDKARGVGEPRTWTTLESEVPCAPLRFGRFQRHNSSHHVGARTVAAGWVYSL